MSRLRIVLILVGLALSVSNGALAATPLPGEPGAGIAQTAHDFTQGQANTLVGLCTFCHTPHKAFQTLLLWNHKLSGNTFTWDVPSTTAGTLFPTNMKGDTYKGPTAKCLSCHDGSVAIGDVAWFNEGGPVSLSSDKISGTFQIATSTGGMAGNHPVAMPYPYLGAKNTYNGVTTGDGATLDEWQPTPLSPIRIFNDDGIGNISAGAKALKTGIECSSCHDPHNKAAVADLFLRGNLTGNDSNYICLKCHIK